MLRTRDIEALVASLTVDEKARLTAGRDAWSTAPVERAGIPPVGMTDGPNGARGSAVLGAGEATAACVPCGSALGATWNPELIERVGALLGEETRTRGCRILLAPTVNLHRSPIAGRNFECFSEDPLLSGRAAAAYVRGVQSCDVAVTVKHLVGNEAETERYTMSSVIDERALRELYLVPFELAIKEGGALGVMTSYNRLNGGYCSENEALLTDILRGEWGFAGFVVSDWYALGTTAGSSRAGLDLEMPGPARFFGPLLAAAVQDGRVEESVVDEQARRLLTVFDTIGALDDPPEQEERYEDRPEHRAVAREAATESMVLLRNEGALPLDPASLRSLAVIGPNADRAQIMGGGSAKLRPYYRVTPLQAIRERFGDAVDVRHERGVETERTAPELDARFEYEVFADLDLGGEPVRRGTRDDGLLMFFRAPVEVPDPSAFSFRARGRFTAAENGAHAFTLVVAGTARLRVDGEVVIDAATTLPPRGNEFFGMASEEIAGTAELAAGQTVELEVEWFSRGELADFLGVKLGCRPPLPPDLADRAVAAAAAADAAVVIVGTNDDWESEGRDRESMDLPGAQNELVERVLAANPRTVIVVNAGSPVTMDWADRAPAVLDVWFGGQEMAAGLAAVLSGDTEPAGRLPTTFPILLEHNPSHGNFPGENGEARYGEGVLVGYRWYEARQLPTRFPFGHGLSYTSFGLSEPRLSSSQLDPDTTLTVEVDVTNNGARRGAEVVQCYVAPLDPRLTRPPKELKAFDKVWLDPGQTATVRLELAERAFAYWDPGDPGWPELRARLAGSPFAEEGERRTDPGWQVDPGRYELHIGRSSADIAHVVPIRVP
jgi:beta-glucosidase